MGRRFWEDGVEIVLEDLNSISSAIERTFFDRIIYELIHRKTDVFFDDSFSVVYSGPTGVNVKKGVGFMEDSSQTSPEPEQRLLYRNADVSKTLSAPDATNDRIDLLVVKAALATELSGSRKFKDAISGTVSTQTKVLQKDWEAEIEVTEGTPAASPVAPAVPAGYVKLAECYVHAVSGMASQTDITDSRTTAPLGADTEIDSTGYSRLTAGSDTLLSTLLSEIDALLKNGYFEYFDLDELGGHPANPAASKRRLYFYNNLLYQKDSGGTATPIGSGGGGGGGLILTEPDGLAPLKEEEYGVDVFKFTDGGGEELHVYMKVPESYIAGTQIKLFFGSYSPSAANTFLMQLNAGLIRVNNDAIDSPAASRDSTNTALTNTVAKQYRKIECDVTDANGQIGGFSAQAGDMLLIKIKRGSGTDTDDVRFLPSSLEPKFSV
jgi:hypothetical protein